MLRMRASAFEFVEDTAQQLHFSDLQLRMFTCLNPSPWEGAEVVCASLRPSLGIVLHHPPCSVTRCLSPVNDSKTQENCRATDWKEPGSLTYCRLLTLHPGSFNTWGQTKLPRSGGCLVWLVVYPDHNTPSSSTNSLSITHQG
jgi:hypothetical protein